MPQGRLSSLEPDRPERRPEHASPPPGAQVGPSDEMIAALGGQHSPAGQAIQQLSDLVIAQRDRLEQLSDQLASLNQVLEDQHAEASALRAELDALSLEYSRHSHTFKMRPHNQGSRIALRHVREYVENPTSSNGDLGWYARTVQETDDWEERSTSTPTKD